MVKMNSKTKYRVMQGEEGKLKFIKISSLNDKYAGDQQSEKNNNNNSPESLSDRTDNIEVNMEMMKIDMINDGVDKKMCNCLKTISSVSRHQCIRPSYRSFSNSNGDLYLLKTKGFLKIQNSSTNEKIFNRTFQHLWNIRFSCVTYTSHVKIRVLTDKRKSIKNFYYKIILYTNETKMLTAGMLGTSQISILPTYSFKDSNYVKYKILIYLLQSQHV